MIKKKTEEFINEARKIHGVKYDYSKVEYIGANKKVCIICPEHGEFWQRASAHISGHGCSKCGSEEQAKKQTFTTENFIEKARKIHGDKYDYSKVEYINARISVSIICPEHGEFHQIPDGHLHGNGCPYCSNVGQITTETFIQKAREVHGEKYDYSKVEYVNNRTKVCIICPIHGEFWQTPSAHIHQKQGCKLCSDTTINQETFIEKARKVHSDKYDYSKVEYIDYRTPVCIICHEKDEYGIEHGEFWQKPANHLRGQNCPKCTNEYSYTTEEWVMKARKVHGDKYDYSKVKYINSKTKVCIICPKHGEFLIYPSNFLKGNGCPKCRVSKLERMIMDILNKKSIKYEYNYRFPWLRKIKPLPVDFYLPEFNTIIECQGEQHLINGRQFKDKPNTLENDIIKSKLCEEHNIKLLYFGEVDFNKININNEIYKEDNYFINRHDIIEKLI